MEKEEITEEEFKEIEKLEALVNSQISVFQPNFSISDETEELNDPINETPKLVEDEALEKELSLFKTKLLPKHSRHIYEGRYKKYVEWLAEFHPKSKPEDPKSLKVYFVNLEATSTSPNSVISIFSSIRSMIKVKFNKDILDYDLTKALKVIGSQYKARKSKVFAAEQVEDFIIKADENKYSIYKLIWLIGFLKLWIA